MTLAAVGLFFRLGGGRYLPPPPALLLGDVVGVGGSFGRTTAANRSSSSPFSRSFLAL